ncbi:DOPA-like domain-containing protein [Glomus cerebriforme]|uniref:DOPA-like domain-containing protein n=1 Tax=Glomus cerebriforme TaxID=658196 RepID=A0A397TK91_9GLOM|nr:DOPA-like domain-containing protein [Glomus cerebriforme]
MLVKNEKENHNNTDKNEKDKKSLSEEEAEEIKEFHFHVYFFQDNEQNRASALALREKIFELIKKGFFHPVPLDTYNDAPRGPHSIGSYEVWCPKEHFSRVYSWFSLHHGVHSVLIHPLTNNEVLDHSDRAAWLGKPVPLDLSKLSKNLGHIPLQYPELGLGYSAPQ